MSYIYFNFLSFIACGFIQECWCRVITKTNLRHYIIDKPNQRSSHAIPTPRGGGAPFVLFAIISFVFLSLDGVLPWTFSIILSITSAIIAALGFLDDIKGLNARLRFSFQISASLLNTFAFFLFYKNIVHIPFLVLILLFCFIYSLSLINFYNFADGINGYVASQFLISAISYIAYIYFHIVQKESYLNYSLIMTIPIVSSILIFLKYNMVKMSVFMGDTGSTFLGAFLAIIFCIMNFFLIKEQNFSAHATYIQPFYMLLTWIFFSQIIFLDCACMVIAKKIMKVPFSQAHKLHTYQILSRNKNMTHTKTTFLLSFIQLFLNSIFIVCSKYINTNIFFVFIFIYLLILSISIVKKHLVSLQWQK